MLQVYSRSYCIGQLLLQRVVRAWPIALALLGTSTPHACGHCCRVTFVDFGMVGSLTHTMKKCMKDVVLAYITRDSRSLVHALSRLGTMDQRLVVVTGKEEAARRAILESFQQGVR